jgi:hypothetical protein
MAKQRSRRRRGKRCGDSWIAADRECQQNRRQYNFDSTIRGLIAENTPEALDRANRIIDDTLTVGSGDINTDVAERLKSAAEMSPVTKGKRNHINPKRIESEFRGELEKKKPSVRKLEALSKKAQAGSDAMALVNENLSSTLENLASDISREAELRGMAADIKSGDMTPWQRDGDVFYQAMSYRSEFTDFTIDNTKSIDYVKMPKAEDIYESTQALLNRYETETDPSLKAAILSEAATSFFPRTPERVIYSKGSIINKDGRREYETLSTRNNGGIDNKGREKRIDSVIPGENISQEAIDFFKEIGVDLTTFVPMDLSENLAEDPYYMQAFPEAIDYLRQKITLGTDTWRDIAGDEHDAFFVVAGAKGALLNQLRELTEQAIDEGWRPDEFRSRFETVAQSWAGNNPWRADLIYRTNIRQSYARGREEYQFDPEVLAVFPYLQFQHSDALEPRPTHIALDGQVFPAQEIPMTLPNGYGCGCRYTSMTEDEARARGISSVRRGSLVKTPAGLQPVEPDDGFDRRPRAVRGAERARIIQRVIERSHPTIAQQILTAIASYVPPSPPPLPVPDEDELEFAAPKKPRRKPQRPLKKKNCVKGKACGGGCIAKTKTCRIQPTASQAAAARAITKELEQQEPVKNGVPVSVLKTEDKIRLQKYESLAVYDLDGNEIFFKDGEEFEVAVTNAELLLLNNAIVTHNHPRGWGFSPDNPQHAGSSFSPDDLLLAAASNAAEMRAVSTGYRHSIKRPDNGWPNTDELRNIIETESGLERILGYDRIDYAKNDGIDARDLQIDKENAEFHHNVATAVAKYIGAKYEREIYSEAI